MDQACECISDAGFALRIDFRPLKSTLVKLPNDALFAVLHSGVEMNKAATTYYNERVVECRIAAQIIVKQLGKVPLGDWSTVRTLKQAETLVGAKDLDEMLSIVTKQLKSEAYSREEVCSILEASDADLAKHSLNNNTQGLKQFWLLKRARHVYSEANRVYQFQKTCVDAQNSSDSSAIKKLAQLMSESHRSCAEDYECSCPELDAKVKECLTAGCLGARLTGAGWGGCVVALVEKHRKEEVAQKLNVLFWSEPSAGIEVLDN